MTDQSTAAVYETMTQAEAAVRMLAQDSYPITQISIVAQNMETEKEVHGFISAGDTAKSGAGTGADQHLPSRKSGHSRPRYRRPIFWAGNARLVRLSMGALTNSTSSAAAAPASPVWYGGCSLCRCCPQQNSGTYA